jgi:hypothetical protein
MRGDAPMTLSRVHGDTLSFLLFTRNEEVIVIDFRLKGCILAKKTTRLTGINKEEANAVYTYLSSTAIMLKFEDYRK